MKLALILPGYLDSPDYNDSLLFEKRLRLLGYEVERLDLGNLWKTGDARDYTVTYFLKQIRERINHHLPKKPKEIVLIGRSRGGFAAIIAGSRTKEVDKIIALCTPPDIKSSAHKWPKNGYRVSQRDLPNDKKKFREFLIPYKFVEDSLKYSAVEEVKNLHKPLMIFIALDDKVVPPELTERIVENANSPYVVKEPNINHDFRFSKESTEIVVKHIENFLKQK